jgi:polyisoprenoid-binding protein YceI
MLLLIGLCASAPSIPAWELKAHKITFKIRNAGITVDGSLSDLKTEIRFDTKDLGNSVLQASVGVASIKTGIGMRDRDLQDRKYFYVEKYPRIKMVSKNIRAIGEDNYKGTFDLTIRDVTKEVEAPFTYTHSKDLGTFKGSFTIDRRDFGVGGNSFILSDDVKIFIEVTAEEK